MTDAEGNRKDVKGLRERAEKLLSRSPRDIAAEDYKDIQALIHELSVYQVELEMQNQNLLNAQMELQASRDMYLALYNTIPAGCLTMDKNASILEANDTSSGLFGVRKRDLVNSSLTHFIAPESQDTFYLITRGIFETGEKQSYELKMKKADGTTFPAYLESIAIKDTDGVIRSQRIAISDISKLKQAEEALRESEERFRIASQIASDVVYERDLQTGIATFYGDIDSHLGYKSGEYPRAMEGWREHVHPKDLAQIDRQSIDRIESGIPYSIEYRMRKKDGTYMTWWDRIMVIRDEKTGKPMKFIGVATDITERKQAEEELRKSEEKFRSIVENSTDQISMLDKDCKFLSINKAAAEISRKSPQEMIGMSIFEIFPEETAARFSKNIKNVFDTGKSMYIEERMIAQGREFDNSTSLSPIKDAKGGVIAVIGIIRDITEYKKLEEQRQKIGRLESIGMLAGGIAHDFNNLLTGIMGNISLAKRHVEPKGEVAERLEEAEKATIRARDLTHQLLTFSRGGAPVKKLITISPLIEESATFVLHGSKVKSVFSFAEDLWDLEADEGQVNQVIHNLVKNAEEAMPEGGVVEISARNITVKDKSTLPLSKGRYVEMTIKDSGIGIKKGNLARMFEPYFTTKHKGSGLGLATAYSIIKNHGGYIDVDSTVGVGTVFHIYLPASKKQLSKKKEEEIQPTFIGQGRILVMDDEAVIRLLLSKVLEGAGYAVETTKDGVEAIERYTKARESGEPFDAVIMDLTIPGGMGGKEAIKKLLEIDPEAKAIVSSGYATDPIISDYKKYGFSAVVAKPYSAFEIEKTLHSLLGKKR